MQVQSGVAKETQRALEHGYQTIIHRYIMLYAYSNSQESQKGHSLATLLKSGGRVILLQQQKCSALVIVIGHYGYFQLCVLRSRVLNK
jgi:hypothetical protein